MFVLEMLRDALCLFHLDLFGRGVQRVVGFAAFRRATHVSGGMRERNTRFGQPDKFDRLLRGDGEWERFRIGQTNVFAGKNDDAPRDETEIFTGMQHFREPVYRAFFVRSAHAFDKCADCVVVRVAGAIVDHGFLLNAFLGNSEREMNYARAVAGGVDLSSEGCFSLETAGLTAAGTTASSGRRSRARLDICGRPRR